MALASREDEHPACQRCFPVTRTEEGLFAVLARNAKNATDYFRLPPEQVVEVGAQIDL